MQLSNKEIADKLNEVANTIEQKGWYNGTDEGSQSPRSECPVTAIHHKEILEAFATYLGWNPRDGIEIPSPFVIRWNDQQPNGEAVVAKLREAANHYANATI